MIAQCTSCGHTFETETWGVQTCPSCGTRVMLDPPAAEAAPEASEPVEVPPPFEDPNVGFLAGYFQTVGKTLFHPGEIFSQMPVANAGRAFLYAWITQVVSGEVAMLWSYLQLRAEGSMMSNLPAGGTPPDFQHMMHTMAWFYGGVGFIFVPVAAAIGVFLLAGLVHLGAMLFGAANRGWNATFRATCYSTGPNLLAVIPICGAFAGSIWALVLAIIALMHTQKTSGGRATGAVLLFPLVLMCLCGILFFVGALAIPSAMQHAMPAH